MILDAPLASPVCHVTVDGATYDRRVSRAEVRASRTNPADGAEVVFDNRNLDFTGKFRKGQKVEVELGYRGLGMWKVFSGEIADATGDRDLTLYCKDRMTVCHRTHITRAFREVTPFEVVSHCLNEAGITDRDLGGKDYPRKSHFILRGANVTQAIGLVERTWGIVGWGHYFLPGGKFFWKKWEPSPEIFVFETGRNVLGMKPWGESWELTTHLFPWLFHSAVVTVREKRLGWVQPGQAIPEGPYRVERVVFLYSGKAFRTHLWVRDLKDIERTEHLNVFGAFQSDH